MPIEFTEQSDENLDARNTPVRLPAERGGNVFQLRGHQAMIYVDPNAEHHGVQAVELGAHFRQNPADLFAIHQQVVRPTNVRPESGYGNYRLCAAKPAIRVSTGAAAGERGGRKMIDV